MKITKRKIKDLIRAEYNPRKITPVEEFDLKESLMRFGLVEPIIININKERKDIVIGGHQRLKIWEQLGNDEIDCNQIDLTLDKERELNIRLNKNGGSFDEDLIKEYFEYEELTEWGFTPDELFEPDEKTIDGLIEDDEIPEVKESKVKRGDIWQLGDHRMMCGDSTSSDDVEKLMNGEKADMVFTDPPYGVNMNRSGKIMNDNLKNDDLYNLINSAFINSIIFSKDCHFYWWIGFKAYSIMEKSFKDNNIKIDNCIVWNKPSIGMGKTGYRYKHELCIFKGEIKDKSLGDVWNFGRDRQGLHPTMKPIELICYALKNSSKSNMLVLDLFLGSGSTLIAAEKLNRKCYGMELDEKYCAVVIERWEQYTGKKAEKISG